MKADPLVNEVRGAQGMADTERFYSLDYLRLCWPAQSRRGVAVRALHAILHKCHCYELVHSLHIHRDAATLNSRSLMELRHSQGGSST